MPHEFPPSAARRPRILLVDDEPGPLRSLRRGLDLQGYEELQASDRASLMAQLVHEPDLVVLDARLGTRSSSELVGEIRERAPGTEVVVVTGHESTDSARLAGALERVRSCVREWPEPADGIVAHSPAMRRVLRLVYDLSRSQSNVLVQGESGTGKELIARAIHEHSPRRSGPFAPVDCGALPDGIVESELYGYERGAFTGAVRASQGLFRAASGGTLFLDEIGELPVWVQAKLLRTLQAREVRPLGSATTIPIDIRIVAATNRDLAEEVRAGRFRADLYYRLCVVSFRLPPLREWPEDIAALVEHFLTQARRLRGAEIEGIEPDAVQLLLAREWPGNVRELENAIEAAVALAPGARLTRADLRPRAGAKQTASRPESIPLSLRAYEQACLEEALRRVDGDVRAAASLLGIGRSTLYRKLERHGIRASKPG